jgi:regulator of protease activity HflC (stomatin/prohibitin superfamily)
MFTYLVALIAIAGAVLKSAVFILKEYERGVVFRLGRFAHIRGPGLQVVIPFVDKLVRVDQRTITMDIPSQDVITRDNVSIKVNAVLYFRVMSPEKAIIQIEDYLYATSQLAQTTLRSVCGQAELDDLLSKREEINTRIQDIVDHQSDPWGVKVSLVEVKHIDLPQEMQRAMAKQAEAERERRAKIIKAEGEFQAAEKLTCAAEIMSRNPATIQLRYLETLRDISIEHNSTILFPVPIDMLETFSKRLATPRQETKEPTQPS